MGGPTRSDDGVNLGCASDPQHRDLSILAELGWDMCSPFHFLVDFGASRKQPLVAEQIFGVGRSEQRVPGGGDVVASGASRGVDKRDGVVDGFFGIRFEGLGHVGEGRLPFQSRAQVADCAHRAEIGALGGNSRVERFANVVRQEGGSGNWRVVAGRDDLVLSAVVHTPESVSSQGIQRSRTRSRHSLPLHPWGIHHSNGGR